MIRDVEFFHGAALVRLVRSGQRLAISPFNGWSNASYVVNDRCGLYLKHSSSRMSPWGFTFRRDHQHEIDEMHRLTGYVVVGLICNDDGVVGLDYIEFRTVLDTNHEAAEGIGISRKPRGMYMVKGRDGELRYRIGEGDFVKKVLGQGT
jgi:hypothetical protein